jgi:sulfite reductase (NADPH) flavoprotein alpha-component
MGDQNMKNIVDGLFFPQEAPFTTDQQAWISGYYAGLNSRLAMNNEKETEQVLRPVHVLYGSQTGNAETVAEDVAENARQYGLAPHVVSLDEVELEELVKWERVMIVTSTYGEGEMPDNAQIFWEAITAQTAPRLENTHYTVLALGDTSYDEFCEAGKLLDLRFEQLGARRIQDRVDCDVDYEDLAANWIETALPEISKYGEQAPEAGIPEAGVQHPVKKAKSVKSKWNRKNPYHSVLAVNRNMSGAGSAKEIRHFEFALGDSDMGYEAGDALGVIPENDPALCDALIARLNASADTQVKGDQPLAAALMSGFEISTPSREFVTAIAARAKDDELTHLVEHGDKEAMEHFLWSKDQLDLLQLYPHVQFSAEEYVDLLKPLQHRAYSISSSPKAAPDHIHLTVASVRYNSHDRDHGGVCSTYIADRIAENGSAPIFVSPNKAFRLPDDDDVPVIMVGPGTGIAPFRAYLQEREGRGASGKNWLFFGDQTRADDFIYEQEMLAWQKSGLLTRLDLAFSRDQQEKIYVQHRMLENAKELYGWLEEGGYFYVCGDATRMAKDVDATLLKIIAEQGQLNEDETAEYMVRLKKEKRYLRDVY